MNNKYNNHIAFSACLAFIMLILFLDIGYGLILTLSLYCVSQFFMKHLTKKLPFLASKIITSIFIIGFFALVYFFMHTSIKYGITAIQGDNGQTLQTVLGSITDVRNKMPGFISKKLPQSAADLEIIVSNLTANLNQHIMGLSGSSINYFFQSLFAFIISISLLQKKTETNSPMILSLKNNFSDFIQSFKVLMGAQVYVALWNAIWLTIYLFAILPAFDIEISYRKTLIILTLFISLIPALGNVISNTALLILCLPFGVYVILASLIFMILIHKAEYLINAKIIGQQSNANVVEILLSLIIFELIFGIDGLILGPVTYAYVKNFLLKEKIL